MLKMIVDYKEGRTELQRVTFGDLVDTQAAKYPDNDCMVYPHDGKERYTYAQFAEKTSEIARGFMSMGIKKGDKVAIWATNVPEWQLTMYGAAKMGGILVTVNTAYKLFELEYLVRQSDSSTLILIDGYRDVSYVDIINELCPELKDSEPGKLQSKTLPLLKTVIFVGPREKTPAGMYNFEDVYDMASGTSEVEQQAVQNSLDPDDIINMQYTSGTTGFPKGVQLSHYNIMNNGKFIGDCMQFTENDRLCITVPLFHCFGIVLASMASMSHGTAMVMVREFHPLRVMEAIDMENCTAVHGVPTMFIAMLGHEDFSKFKFAHMRTGIMAGSLCPINVMKRVVEEMHMRHITSVFGQTECSPGMTQTTTDDSLELRVSTVGRMLPHCEGKIIDPDTGLDCPYDVPGEIVTRGYHVMCGYYKMPEATTQAIDKEGWLHTGDIGTMDEKGYFRVTGRLKDMIIRGGENIYPREIEEFLYTHPAVSDVQVVGVPDKKYGEEIMAFVILNGEQNVTEQELIEFVRDGMSRYKKPRHVKFIDAFPMTASGKIQKFKLREMGRDEIGEQYEDGYKA